MVPGSVLLSSTICQEAGAPASIESLYDSEVHGGNCWLELEAPP